MPSHRLGTATGTTTLGVGISLPVVYTFCDPPRDYADFVALYARWLHGPQPLDPSLSDAERRAEQTLNWRVFGKAAPTLADLAALGWYPGQHAGPLGLWQVRQVDYTGIPEHLRTDARWLNDVWMRTVRPEELAERTTSELWARNIVTDNGATAMLKNTFNNAGSAVAIMNHMVMDFGNYGFALQTGAAINNASGAQTSIATGGGVQVANIPNNAVLTWSYGTSNAETWTAGSSSPGNLAATSITVVSQTTTSGHTHSAGDYIVQQPSTSDNPSSVSNSTDSGALSSGAYTFSGTGAGNRKVQIQFAYPASPTTPAGAYTSVWMSNAGTIASNSTAAHLLIPPQTVNSSGGVTMTISESL